MHIISIYKHCYCWQAFITASMTCLGHSMQLITVISQQLTDTHVYYLIMYIVIGMIVSRNSLTFAFNIELRQNGTKITAR